MVPKLVEEEAHRVVALSIVALGLLASPFVLRALKEPVPAPSLRCEHGAHRAEADGRIACGAGEGRPLSPAEALLLGTPIDVERAQAPDLQVVPGIGPKLAARIVEDRARRGPFGSVDGLERVPGIGPKLLSRMKPYLRSGL